MSTYQEIVDREQKYLLNTYARYPIAIARGKGVYVFTTSRASAISTSLPAWASTRWATRTRAS